MALNTFRDAIRKKDFVVTAELPLKLESTAAELRNNVTHLRPVVDAVQITDDRAAVGRMSNLAAASIAMQLGVDTVLHLSCRDRNRIALQADLLGAAALGVTSFVLLRGAKFENKQAKGVFEVDAEGLTALARVISEEKNLVAPPGLFLGAQATVFAAEDDWPASGIRNKIESGTRFFQSQPCSDIDRVAAYVSRLIDLKILHQASMLITVPLLCSRREVQAFKDLYPAAVMADNTSQRLSQAGDSLVEGIRICAEVVAGLREISGVTGVNVLYGGNPENVVTVLRSAGITAQGNE